MSLSVTPQSAPCGAVVRGLDLSEALSRDAIAAVRAAWLNHQVLVFPEQSLALEDFERFATTMGPYGIDPYFHAMPGHPHVAEIRREADETTALFAEAWHSDWSFLPRPPSATLLYSEVIPPIGGDTLFANQYAAWEALPAATRVRLAGLRGIHSARRGYSRAGTYGERDAGRSMTIRFDDSALATELHPIGRVHPETGRTALFVSPGYTIGIDGMSDAEAEPILRDLFVHQSREEFIYRHGWAKGMLVMWDNRCIVHAATGGYQGHARLLRRITVADQFEPA